MNNFNSVTKNINDNEKKYFFSIDNELHSIIFKDNYDDYSDEQKKNIVHIFGI